MKKLKIFRIIIVAILTLLSSNVLAQPAEFAGDINSWATPAMNDRGSVKAIRVQASATNANSGFKFRSTGSWSPQWGGSDGDFTRGLNARLSGQAYYSADGGGGWEHNLEFNMTSGNYYTFIVGQLAPTNNNDLSILETAYNPNTITSVSHSPATPNSSQTVTVTATLSAILNAGEFVFIRYSTNGWGSSNLIAMSFSSGTDYVGSIPVQSDGTTVSYYVLTSNDNTFAASDADYFSLELNNNSGSNYSYTVSDALYTTTQDGDWEDPNTWTCNCVPPAGAITQINHAVDVSTNIADNPSSIEISAGDSIIFGANGQISATTITNDGTIDMTAGGLLTIAATGTLTNNSTFTAGTGEVYFPGTATVSGSVTFYDASLAGGVNFGGSSSIDNILQIYGGGYFDVNSITYNSGSTLKYAANYTLNSGDKTWYSNVASSGSAQEGVPWNVEIPSGVSVKLNDVYQYDMNGDLLINGTFELGGNGGSNWGDLGIQGDFTLNVGATFTHNDRSVKFIGSSNQLISGTLAATFAYLEVNNSAGVTLNQDINIATGFTFTSGKMTLGDNNVNIGTASLSGYGTDKYFITSGTGYVVRNVGGTEVDFPVGITSSYTPAFLTQNDGSGAEDLFVRVKQRIDNPTQDDEFAVNLQWTIDEETAGSNDITTKFQWTSNDENIYFDNQSDVQLGRFIGTYSVEDVTVIGSDPYTVSASGMTDDISAEIPFVVGNVFAFSASGYRTAQNGDWATGSTWVGGVVPPANSRCAILHHVTSSSALNDADAVTIYSNKSVTFNASGTITVNGTFSNKGMLKTANATANVTINGTLKNQAGASVNMVDGGTLTFTDGSSFISDGSFTGGTGTVDYLGAGSASGTLAFNNINIAGNVDLGANASLNNILTVNALGDLINNTITYQTGSTLKFNRTYILGDDKIWFRNNDATGSEQQGIPWNVEVAVGNTVTIGDNQFRAINGNLIINGTFETGAAGGGDFRLKGNFENNGTYTHNFRQVEFYGISNQKITGSNPTTLAYLKVNNSANISLEISVTVVYNIDFLFGKIVLGDNNLTVFGSINAPGSAKYIATNGSGYLIQKINASSSKFYPIGTLSSYNPANLSQGAAAISDDIGVRVQNSIDNAVDNPTQVVNVQWTLNDAVAGGNDLTTQFYWNLTDEAGSFVRTSGTVETRYFSAGSYLPVGPPYSTIAGGNPYDATAAYSYTGNLVNLPFIVADASAFSSSIYTINNGPWNAPATWNGGVIPGNPYVAGQCAVVKHNVTLDIAPTVKSVSVSSSGNLDCNGQTITLEAGGAISNSGTFNANGGKVVFSGAGSISTGAITFNDVDLNGPVSFGSNTTIAGFLTINNGGSVNTNAPFYANSSTLKYNQSGNISRGSEWQYNIAETDPGYPANVQVSNSTVLDVDADNNDNNYYNTRFLKGNLTVDASSEISLGDMGGGVLESQICGLYTGGNIINNGTITLSSFFGGDMMLDGDLINTGTINWNSRAVFFTGDEVDQNITGVAQIPFILMTRGANVVLNNDLEVNGTGTEFITFARPSSTKTGSIDLQSYTLSCTGDGNIELNNISGALVTGTGRVEVSGGDATYSGINSGTLSFGSDVTLAINGGTMTFPENLGIVTIYGTLEVGDGATISNIPTYGNNSTLHYKKGGSFTMGVEWGPGADAADNIPKNVTLSEGSTPSVFNMNDNRHALGELLIEQNATFKVAAGTGQLTVNNLTVDANGTILLKSPADNGVAGSLITLGTVTNNGTMKAERFVSRGKYTYLSPPNLSTNSQLFTNNSNGYFNPNFYYYNQAFDALVEPGSATYSIWKDDSYGYSDAWIEAHDGEGGTGITLDVPCRGYAYYNDIDKMFVFDGTFTTADQLHTVTYDDNDNSQAGVNGYFDGWNLMANPFPSALDWEDASWDKTYVDASVYYWDGTFENEGNYKYYVASTYNDGTNVVNGGSQFIPASQAFFVKAKSTVGSGGQEITIPNDARKHSGQDFWGKSNSSKSTKTSNGFFRLQANVDGFSDELVVRYIPEATDLYDGDYDAYKMYSFSTNMPQIYTYNELNGAGYAINSLPVSDMDQIVPVGFEIGKNGVSNCDIQLLDYNMNNNHIYIQDVNENTVQNLISNPNYNFILQDSADIRERFFIYFEENVAPIVYSDISDYTIDYGDTIDYTIPDTAFADANLGDVLTYTATHDGGEPLPDWLQFDQTNGRFYGIPIKAGYCTINVVATDQFGEQASSDFVMTVNVVLPELTTDSVLSVFDDRALIKATILNTGGEALDDVGFCWSTSQNPTLSDNYNIVNISNTTVFSEFIYNLNANTTYYVRSYAKNNAGISYGNELSFNTSPLGLNDVIPIVTIYPNPAVKNVFIESEEQINFIKLTDVTGKVIYLKYFEKGSNKAEIDLKNISRGVYFIETQVREKVYMKKLIVE